MKTTKNAVGRAYDMKKEIQGLIEKLEAVSPRTPEIEASLEDLKNRVLQLHHAINTNRVRHFLAPAFEWKEHAEKHSQTQRQKRGKRRTWNGLTREQLSARDESMIEHYKKASKNGHISLHGFAIKHADKYCLKPTRIKQIIKSSLDI